jgi:hypothetical protein
VIVGAAELGTGDKGTGLAGGNVQCLRCTTCRHPSARLQAKKGPRVLYQHVVQSKRRSKNVPLERLANKDWERAILLATLISVFSSSSSVQNQGVDCYPKRGLGIALPLLISAPNNLAPLVNARGRAGFMPPLSKVETAGGLTG